MTKSRLEQKVLDDMQEIIDRQKSKKSDGESDHVEADDLLCEFLLDLGYDDIVTAYKLIDRWYG